MKNLVGLKLYFILASIRAVRVSNVQRTLRVFLVIQTWASEYHQKNVEREEVVTVGQFGQCHCHEHYLIVRH